MREALKEEDWSCIFLHDVDLLPENDHNTYTCHPQYPTHLSIAMDKFRYRYPTHYHRIECFNKAFLSFYLNEQG